MHKVHAAGFAVLASLSLLSSAPASAHDVKVGDLVIEHPWARATPGGAQVAGGYLTIINTGTVADRLTGGSLEAATTAEFHQMSTTDGIMTMRPTGPLDIPPGGRLTLDPSSKHIMFLGLKKGLKKGETIGGTLVFDHAGTVTVSFDVEGMGAKGPSQTPSVQPSTKAGHAGQSMPGMDMD
ncbi:copper chaperone PCu(A)C [Lichenihabitans psoromatis]|uniref:copper chaperone PCu(A)C n=1 Tax=Lichenihabitans psoromatis TaxID=2528642 RepID=UPI001036E029|nr:copper chaperone PCu(A)C [Lichenihabitans psoromatis]